ncbi:aminopeptidase [Planctomycetales bacterium ZRK34]|nr:aminopeptidase [Planctomycetales bacterium ZRK34]
MRDARIDKLADVLVNYSTAIKPGQLVRLTGDPVAMPLLEALYEKLIIAGAHVLPRINPGVFGELFYEHANEDQLKYVPKLLEDEVALIDASIGIWAETNTKALTNADTKKQGVASSARRGLWKTFMTRAAEGKLHWVGTQYPTDASAQDAEMSLREYEEFVFKAGHLDKADPVAAWMEVAKKQQIMTDYLNDGRKHIHFQAANGTDLHVDIEGMTWINCCGRENFPDGEVFTGPNQNAPDGGVNGVVKYSFPAVHHGVEVDGIELTFEKGVVVDAKATKNQKFLIDMLDQDPGARRFGEVAIGTNYEITRYTKNTLFDEKIGGTFHAAVGAGYPETGNTNESGLHWDMVCDLRPEAGGGTITVDGEVISRDGQFTFEGWPGR